MFSRDVISFKPEQYQVGLSSAIGVTVSPGQLNVAIQWISGGTLFIGGSSQFVGASGFMLVNAGDGPLKLDLSGTFWLNAAGATVVCSVLKGISSGNQ